MALSIGIVGLPNVGKSTTFNALTKARNAAAANYPFCTIDPNNAIVPVPDPRLQKISAIANPQKVIPAVVEFVDIAGLVRGASKGEGLGNQFLAHIRETSAIVHVVRCFDDENVIHVDGKPNPARDIDTIETELIISDVQALEKRIDRLQKAVRADKKAQPLLDMANEVMKQLDKGKLLTTFEHRNSDEMKTLMIETPFITAKKMIFAANVDEAGLSVENDYVKAVRELAKSRDAEVVKLCAVIEEEMVEMTDEERAEFLKELGAEESGLEQIIHKGYHALDLISYFTAGEKEVRAWTIERGWKAPAAAGVIHSDFERGFIRAEVIAYDDFIALKGEAGAKAAGKMRVEGKDYVVADGDVMHFRFSV